MLKINIIYETNIKFSNSKSLLNKIYKKVFFFKIMVLYSFFLKKKINKYILNNENNYLKNKITLIRSPFHYKTSKSILNFNQQKFIINIFINNQCAPIFINKNTNNFLKELNTHNNFIIKKIKIKHNVKF